MKNTFKGTYIITSRHKGNKEGAPTGQHYLRIPFLLLKRSITIKCHRPKKTNDDFPQREYCGGGKFNFLKVAQATFFDLFPKIC